MKSEIEFGKDGRMFLTIDANISNEDEQKLYADGWIFLNNGVTLSDGTPALYFWKKVN